MGSWVESKCRCLGLRKTECCECYLLTWKEENRNLIVWSKGQGTFIHPTNLCDVPEQGPQCPLGNNSGKGEYHEASVQVIQVPGCACVSLGTKMESGERLN